MEKLAMDLQLFYEDEAPAEETAAEAVTDGAAGQGAPDEALECEDIPPELEGIDEETARAIMREAAARREEAVEPAGNKPENSAEESPDAAHAPAQIPYARFQEVEEQKQALEEELAKWKAGRVTAAPPQAQAPAPPPTSSQEDAPAIQLTPEVMAQVDRIAAAEAMKMTGLTKEEIDALEYAEGDAKRAQWDLALNFAKNQAVAAIAHHAKQRAESDKVFMERHAAAVEDFNGFYAAAAAEADFEKVRAYAVGDYFATIPAVEQDIIADAYRRMERQTASPQDIMIVKNYFVRAKADYAARRQTPPAAATGAPQSNIKEKFKQMDKHPRVEQITGVADPTDMTAAELERMFEEKDWDNLPPKIQKMLLGE